MVVAVSSRRRHESNLLFSSQLQITPYFLLLQRLDFFKTSQVDVYSFGIVMWELLTGEEPYADLHYGTIIGKFLFYFNVCVKFSRNMI